MKHLLAVLLCLMLIGCASTPNRRDPLEPVNRVIFSFNDKADEYVLKPVAEGYKALTPTALRAGVSNFFGNIADLFSGVNNLLQAKPERAGDSFGRFVVNSSFGLAGLFDVAGEAGIERAEEDFGQTLGVWGAGPGPYLVLPLLGPSSVRDALGTAVQGTADPVNRLNDVAARNATTAVRVVNTRAELLGTERIVEQAALDKYIFVRGAYLRRRQSLVHDGKPPVEEDDD